MRMRLKAFALVLAALLLPATLRAQYVNGKNFDATPSAVLPWQSNAGDALVVGSLNWIGTQPTGGYGFTDTGGDQFNPIVPFHTVSGASWGGALYCADVKTTEPSETIKSTLNTTMQHIDVAEFKGYSCSQIDTALANPSTSAASASFATVGANELVIAWVLGNATSYTWPSGWTAPPALQDAANGHGMAYQVVATAGSYSLSIALPSGNPSLAEIAAFIAPTPGPAPTIPTFSSLIGAPYALQATFKDAAGDEITIYYNLSVTSVKIVSPTGATTTIP